MNPPTGNWPDLAGSLDRVAVLVERVRVRCGFGAWAATAAGVGAVGLAGRGAGAWAGVAGRTACGAAAGILRVVPHEGHRAIFPTRDLSTLSFFPHVHANVIASIPKPQLAGPARKSPRGSTQTNCRISRHTISTSHPGRVERSISPEKTTVKHYQRHGGTPRQGPAEPGILRQLRRTRLLVPAPDIVALAAIVFAVEAA